MSLRAEGEAAASDAEVDAGTVPGVDAAAAGCTAAGAANVAVATVSMTATTS